MSLRTNLIRLAHANPALRPHLVPLLRDAAVKKLPSAGVTQRWSVLSESGQEIGLVEKNRSTANTLEPYHAILKTNGGVTEKDIGAFYDKAESEKKGPRINEDALKKIKWGGLDAAVQAIQSAVR